MSNVERMRKFYSLFKSGDKQGCLSLCDDAIAWRTMEDMPAGGTYVGKHAAFDEYFPKIRSSFAELHASNDEYLNAGTLL